MNIRTLAIVTSLAVGLYSCGDAGNDTTSETTEDATTETTEATESTEVAAATYTIDVATSTVAWKGTMVGIYSHEGVIGLTEGSLTTEGGAITGGSFTIDASAISTTDDDALYATGSREDLVGHLTSDDFLGDEANPNGTFTITSVDGTSITGDLTLKGKTNSEVITDVTVTEADGTITATGSLTFDRQKYGISFEKGGEMVVSDDIELTISLSGSAN